MQIVKNIVTKVHLYLMYFFVNLRRFSTSLIKHRHLTASDIGQFNHKGFVRLGIASFCGISAKLAPMIDELNNTGTIRDPAYTVIGRNDRGVKAVAVDLNSDFLWDYVLTKELYELIRGYYGRNFFLRNNPTIEFSYDGESNDAQKFHLDWGLQQVSLMVNLIDVSTASTHMEYLVGSNRKYYLSQLDRDSDRCRRAVRDHISAYPQSQETTVGVADSAFIFDAGNGFHRQVKGGRRIMLHMNFVENLAFTYWDSRWQPPAGSEAFWFSELSDVTQKRIEHAGLPSTLFNLVNRSCARQLLTPLIYRQTLA